MSRVFLCLFAFFIFCIAIRFGNCENSTKQNEECNDANITIGSDKTYTSPIEQKLIKNSDFINKITGRNKSNNNEKTGFGKLLEEFKKHVHAIFPGTLWCGDGDIARNENSLGIFHKTDACCRSHDNCNNNIEAGETKLNLKNNGIFTRSACYCDQEFHTCLKKANNPIATQIGLTYFSLLNPQCFQCVCPTENCDNADRCQCTKYTWVNNTKF